jgi:four helix bundle protein
MGDFKKLKVWRRSHDLTLAVYHCTMSFPDHERFGLTAQLRRAAASVPANIAEGCGRRTDNELARFLRISLGSATELEYHLLLAKDIGLLSPELHDSLSLSTSQIQGMLAQLERRLSVKRQAREPLAHN